MVVENPSVTLIGVQSQYHSSGKKTSRVTPLEAWLGGKSGDTALALVRPGGAPEILGQII